MKDDGTFDEIKNPYQESTTRAGILTKISADGKLLWSNMVCVQESANNSQVTSVAAFSLAINNPFPPVRPMEFQTQIPGVPPLHWF